MTHKIGDRVRETSTTATAGNFTLDGAVPNFIRFGDIASNGDTVAYAIVNRATAEFETGIGTWLTGHILQRDVIRQSSNGNAIVAFSAGTKDVYCTILALGGIFSGSIASGQIGAMHLASGVISATALTSGAIQSGHIGNAAVNSGNVASGSLSAIHMASGTITGAALTSGVIQSGHIGNAAVVSGSIAPNTIVDYSRKLTFSAVASETISGTRAVAFNSSGDIRIASTYSGGFPCVGVVYDNVLSGSLAEIIVGGMITPGVSGYVGGIPGRSLCYNVSGFIGVISGGMLSGGHGMSTGASGAWYQAIGRSMSYDGTMVVSPDMRITSGLQPIGIAGQWIL